MTLPRRTRRQIDAAVGALIAVVVAVVAVVLWLGSDFRATADDTVPQSAAPSTPAAPSSLPSALTQRWTISTDPRYGAIASPYGTVITADEHTVTGHDVRTGRKVWSYSRSNRQLCGIGSGDTQAYDLGDWPSGVHGIATLYAKNGWCSQVTLLNPSTGARLYQRTSPNETGGQLFFGVPYVGWLGHDYLELWRHDLYATIRYGNQPNPVNSDGPHLGCTFTDAAVTDLQLATIEHCQDKPGTAQLVLNWPTPKDAPDNDSSKGWDENHSQPKTTIDTHSPVAVIVGITSDRAAVLVSEPQPAMVIYDSSGKQISRTPVDVSAAEITQTAKAGITPSVVYQDRRYSLVGHHLLSVSSDTVTVTVTKTTTSAPPTGEASRTSTGPQTKSEANPVLDWIAPDSLGLPALIGDRLLVPTQGGLMVRPVEFGAAGHVIPVQRHGYTGRVDATAVGNMIVEVRGGTVVGLVAG